MQTKSRWTSSTNFILASAGAAVGLGNIWRFPYVTGENGGGAFVISYLICIILLAWPLVMSETMLGRIFHKNPVAAIGDLCKINKKSSWYRWAGMIPVLAGPLILTYYTIITGWVLHYLGLSLIGTIPAHNALESKNIFNQLTTNPGLLLIYHTIILILVAWVCSKKIQDGIEKVVRILFPLLFATLIILIIYANMHGHLSNTLTYLFHPNWHKFTAHSLMLALGQAFFSVGIATGIIFSFGSYLPEEISISKTSAIIVIVDTSIALLAGCAIFPLVFAQGIPASSGPGLIFESIPLAANNIAYGNIFLIMFFFMIFMAAYTSCIALIEPLVLWIMQTFNMKRPKAVGISTFLIWLVGLGSIGAFAKMPLFTFNSTNFYNIIDNFTANIMLPLGGLIIAFCASWGFNKQQASECLNLNAASFKIKYWRIINRWVAPICIIGILYYGLA